MEAEKRLHEAEESLARLEAALDRQQQLLQQRTVEKDADDAMVQMIGDVNTLKSIISVLDLIVSFDTVEVLLSNLIEKSYKVII